MPLARTLGLREAVGVGLGAMLGAGVFVVWAPAAAAAGPWLLVALVIAGAVAVCNPWSSTALAVRYPSAGGTYVYGRERLGDLPGYLAGWCFVVGKLASCAAMAMTIGVYAAPDRERWAAAAAVVLVVGLNLAGVQRSARVSGVLAASVLSVLAALVVAVVLASVGGAGAASGDGVETVFTVERLTAAAHGVSPFEVLQAAGLIFFAFAGYARIATLAEEVVQPQRTIPRAVTLTVGVVLVAYGVVALLTLGVLGAERLARSTAPLAEVARVVAGQGGVWLLGAAAIVAALAALLNLLLGVSRTTMAMARGGHLPGALARVGGSRGVPYVAELLAGGIVLAVVLAADLRGAIGFSSFGVLLYYAVANASALTLRGDWRWAATVPVVGLAGCLVLALSLPLPSVLGGAAVVGIGLLGYGVTAPRRRGRAATGPPAPCASCASWRGLARRP